MLRLLGNRLFSALVCVVRLRIDTSCWAWQPVNDQHRLAPQRRPSRQHSEAFPVVADNATVGERERTRSSESRRTVVPKYLNILGKV